jgi:hypothetical protein
MEEVNAPVLKYPSDETYVQLYERSAYGIPISYKYYLRLKNDERKRYKNMVKLVMVAPIDTALISLCVAVELIAMSSKFAFGS